MAGNLPKVIQQPHIAMRKVVIKMFVDAILGIVILGVAGLYASKVERRGEYYVTTDLLTGNEMIPGKDYGLMYGCAIQRATDLFDLINSKPGG